MVSEEVAAWRRRFLRHSEWFPDISGEVVFQRGLRQVAFQLPAQDRPVVVEADESLIERRVVQAGKAQAVLRIQSFCQEFASRQNVAGDQKFADGNSRHAAAPIERVQNHPPEELLPTADLDLGRLLGGAVWRWQLHAPPQFDSF